MSEIKDHALKILIEALWIHGRNKDASLLQKVDAQLAAIKEENERLTKKIKREEEEHMVTVDQRDRAEEMADQLSWMIGELLGVDVGEHSSGNCPWQNAKTAIQESRINDDLNRLKARVAELAAPAVQGDPVEYQCHICRKTTPPPAPFKAYVKCGECGALTAASIAARLAASQPTEQSQKNTCTSNNNRPIMLACKQKTDR